MALILASIYVVLVIDALTTRRIIVVRSCGPNKCYNGLNNVAKIRHMRLFTFC